MKGLAVGFACIVTVLAFICAIWLPYFVPQEYVFYRDGNLLISSDSMISYWEGYSNGNGTYNIKDGVAELYINESSGSQWGFTTFSQGEPHYPMLKMHPPLLGGQTYSSAKPIPFGSGVTFWRNKPLPSQTYFLTSKIYMENRSFEHDRIDGKGDYAKCAIGVDFFFSYVQNGKEVQYKGMGQWTNSSYVVFDIYLSSAEWNGTAWNTLTQNEYYIRDNNHVIGYRPSNLLTQNGTWRQFQVDMNDVFLFAFNNLPSDITSLKLKCSQIYVEGIGASISGKFDFIQMQLYPQ